MIDLILQDLKSRYGDRVLLTPEDLVGVLGVSVGQQANLRSRGKFPVSTTKVGNLVRVTIYDLAKYLSGECVSTVKMAPVEDTKPLSRGQKKARKGLLEKDWWLTYQVEIYSYLDKRAMQAMVKNIALLRGVSVNPII